MQYYRLERDIEIAIVDFTEQSLGNGLVVRITRLFVKFSLLQSYFSAVQTLAA